MSQTDCIDRCTKPMPNHTIVASILASASIWEDKRFLQQMLLLNVNSLFAILNVPSCRRMLIDGCCGRPRRHKLLCSQIREVGELQNGNIQIKCGAALFG